jgi:hypothetical protein
MKHCKHVLWLQEQKYTAKNKAGVATVLVNLMFPFISSAVTGKVEVKFSLLQTAQYQCLQKRCVTLRMGLLTAQSLLWFFSIQATGTTRISLSATHKIKDLSSFLSPSIGV